MKGQHLDVVAVSPIGAEIVARVTEAVAARAGIAAGRQMPGDLVIAVGGQTRPHAPLVVDPKLRERPFPLLDRIEHNVPAAVVAGTKAAHAARRR